MKRTVWAGIPAREPECKEGKTTAKKHFTEDTLLSAMENASADEMPEEAERKGIGTPATRAGIIARLISRQYIQNFYVTGIMRKMIRQVLVLNLSQKEAAKKFTGHVMNVDING